jgi:hypothetical protein
MKTNRKLDSGEAITIGNVKPVLVEAGKIAKEIEKLEKEAQGFLNKKSKSPSQSQSPAG